MKKFTTLQGICAPMDLINIDTDMILPKQYLKVITRTGLGIHAFEDIRYSEDGNEIPDFILNDPHYRNAQILIAGDNFGCGSSREHAPWALADFGIKCVISTSIADIFYNNCFNNGICPIILPPEDHREIMNLVKTPDASEITINLERKTIVAGNKIYPFDMDDALRNRLLNGLDHIGITLEHEDAITEWEFKDAIIRPWA